MPGKATPRRQRAPRLVPEVRRPLILDAALRVYLRDGFDGASMDAIAEEAGVTKPVLYSSFPGKTELFAALLERERHAFLEAMADALPREMDTDNPEDVMSHGLRAYLRAVSARPDSFRATLSSQGQMSPAASATLTEARALMATQIAALCEQWLRSVGAQDAKRTATITGHAVVGAAENLARLLLDEPQQWEPDELADVLTTLLIRGSQGLSG